MDLFLGTTRITLTDADLLGEGGEARVFRWKDLAVKVFHPPAGPAASQVRAQKLRKLARFPTGLPDAVIGPLELAKDKKGAVLGYAMKAVLGAEDFGRLASRKWREQVVPNAQVMALFRSLHAIVKALHGRGVVVGDLNDGNVLFRDQSTFLIDADSMQFDALPCAVGHERFLDPRLYGVDLCAAARFSPATDWYAFAVLLFSSLLYVHPYGGTHPTLATLLRRAEARHPVTKSDVTLPRAAVAPAVLSDDALHWFGAVFEKDERTEPPAALLSLQWTRCGCGLEHARAVCPECHALGPLATRPALRAKGRCTARVAFQTRGRVLAAALQGGLRYAYQEDGVVRREDGGVVARGPLLPGTRVALCGPSTWLADPRGRVERVEGGRTVERAQTQVRGTVPVLAAASSAVYRQENDWLVESLTGARVGQVLEGQTWLWTGERLGLGFYRAGGFTFAFLLRTGRPGLLPLTVHPERSRGGVGSAEGSTPLTINGRLVEAEAVFDERHALLSVVIETGGRETVWRWLFDASGRLLGSGEGGARGHAALLGGRVLIGTDAGLVLLKLDCGLLVEAVRFDDTQSFVGAGDELLPQPDGSLFVVGPRDITQLTLT